MSVYDDEDIPRLRFSRVDRYTATKEYKCYNCQGTIEVGDRYNYTVFMTDDDTKPYVTREHSGWCRYESEL